MRRRNTEKGRLGGWEVLNWAAAAFWDVLLTRAAELGALRVESGDYSTKCCNHLPPKHRAQ